MVAQAQLNCEACFARLQVLQGSVNPETGKREASVVAPCPHDGQCPMQATQSWCHFVQRFERSSLQRVTKLRQDGGLARTYQVWPPSRSSRLKLFTLLVYSFLRMGSTSPLEALTQRSDCQQPERCKYGSQQWLLGVGREQERQPHYPHRRLRSHAGRALLVCGHSPRGPQGNRSRARYCAVQAERRRDARSAAVHRRTAALLAPQRGALPEGARPGAGHAR